MSRSESLLKLAAAYGRHQLRNRLRTRRPELERLLETYAPDHLQPLTSEERAAMPAMSACINCGLCALVAGRLGSAHLPDLASGYLRALPLLVTAAHDLEGAAADLQAAAAACPTGVPLAQMASMISRLGRA